MGTDSPLGETGDGRGLAPINARAEHFPKNRCSAIWSNAALPGAANGFYEWKNLGDHKQPYYITVPDDPLFAFAGLYDSFVDDQGEPVDTYTIITTQPNEMMADLHNRMPAILRPGDEAEWLDPDVTDPAQVERLLVPYPADEMRAYPVSRKWGIRAMTVGSDRAGRDGVLNPGLGDDSFFARFQDAGPRPQDASIAGIGICPIVQPPSTARFWPVI